MIISRTHSSCLLLYLIEINLIGKLETQGVFQFLKRVSYTLYDLVQIISLWNQTANMIVPRPQPPS